MRMTALQGARVTDMRTAGGQGRRQESLTKMCAQVACAVRCRVKTAPLASHTRSKMMLRVDRRSRVAPATTRRSYTTEPQGPPWQRQYAQAVAPWRRLWRPPCGTVAALAVQWEYKGRWGGGWHGGGMDVG
jgi:hypothetical protein